MLSPTSFYNAAKSEATVYIYDAIGGWFGIDPREWVPEFNSITAKTIHLRINSPGGSVFDAQAMKTAIAQHPSRVVAHVDGMAASAATTLAIAAREVEMTNGAMWLIHNAWGLAMGGAEDLESYADLLRKATSAIAQDYVRKTGKTIAQVKAWMDAETWFTASEAKRHGFVDRIFEDKPGARGASAMASADLNSPQAWRERELCIASYNI
ncbi:MAG: Clp protease ClpP [Desulfovibrionales bacterium]|nr:Clp protease ClpP [Desulfovibrionales bacterium]